MAKKAAFPKPSKRFLHGSWVILWRYSPSPGEYKQYTVATEFTRQKDDEIFADRVLNRFAVALGQEYPEFPVEYSQTSGVRRYMEDRFGTPGTGDWLADYEPLLSREVSIMWAKPSISLLKRLKEFCGGDGFERVTPDQARDFLVNLLADKGKGKKKRGTVAWRNRALSMCNRFFKWAVETRRARLNPFDGIKMLKEPKKGEIVYCTRQERERIIAMAKATEWPDWMAVPIAFYSGMRKEEIARMEWKDIQFAEGRISVPISKTLEPRLLPMSAQLRELLESVQEADRHGHVVNMPAGADRLFRLENLHRKIRKLNQGIGRWKKDKSKNKTDAEKEQKPIPDERIGWNAWRHTFGSLLSQSGVSLDKISSWMGNTPDVCRRHYAQFVPRDRHDEDIDKL